MLRLPDELIASELVTPYGGVIVMGAHPMRRKLGNIVATMSHLYNILPRNQSKPYDDPKSACLATNKEIWRGGFIEEN